MLRRIVDISTEGLFLNHRRGFLVISKEKEEIGTVPLDDISVLMLTAQGITVTKDVYVSLIEQGSVVVICGTKYNPISVVTPLFGNYEFSGKLKKQIAASEPLKKRIWQSIIKSKILNQALLLQEIGLLSKSILLKNMCNQVQSGDSTNREAYAAREYWNGLFGEKFLRNQDGEDAVNSYLNYGYAVLRGLIARYVCASGLLPSLGIFHHNEQDNMCLVDDLMEPFRIIIDMFVLKYNRKHPETDMINWKKTVIQELPEYKVRFKDEVTKLSVAIEQYCNSLCQSYESKENRLCIPEIFPKTI